MVGGRDIYGRYYKDNLIVFTDIGEIVAVDINGTGDLCGTTTRPLH